MRVTIFLLVTLFAWSISGSTACGNSARLNYYRQLTWKQLVHRLLLLDEQAFMMIAVVREERDALLLYQAMKEAAAKQKTSPEPLILAEAIVSDLYAVQLTSENHRRRVARIVEDLLRRRSPQHHDAAERMTEIALLRFSRYLVAQGEVDLPARVLRELAENPPTQWESHDRAIWAYCHGMLGVRLAEKREHLDVCRVAVKRMLSLFEHWFPRSQFPKGHPAETRHWMAHGLLAHYSGENSQAYASFEKAAGTADWGLENGILCPLALIESLNARAFIHNLAVALGNDKRALEAAQQRYYLLEEAIGMFPNSEVLRCARINSPRSIVKMLFERLEQVDWCIEISRTVIKETHDLARPLTAKETLVLALLYGDLAVVYVAQHSMLEAIAAVDTAWQLFQEIPDSFKEKHRYFVSVACIRADIHNKLQSYVVAHETLNAAMRCLNRHGAQLRGRKQLELRVWIHAANLAFAECDYESMIRLMRRVEGSMSLEEMSPGALQMFTGFRVRLALARGDVDEAWTAIDDCHRLIEKRRANTSPDAWRGQRLSLERMRAVVLGHEGKWRACLDSLDRSVRQLSQAADPSRFKASPDYCRLSAQCLAALGDYDRALAEVDRAEATLAEWRKAGYGGDYLLSTTLPALRGQILMAKQDYRQAAACLLEVARREPQVFASTGATRSIHTATRWALRWERGCDLLMSVEQPAKLDLNCVYDRILPYRGLLFRMLAQDAKLRRASLSDKDRSLYREYRNKQMEVARLTFEAGLADGARKEELQEAIGKAERRRNELELKLRQRRLPVVDRSESVSCSGLALKNQLAKGEVLLDFVEYCRHSWDPRLPGVEGYRGEEHYRVYIVAPDAKLQFLELGTCAEIDREIDAWRKAVSEGDGVPCGWKLSRLLWHRIRKHLPKGTRRLFIAPAGKISLISWAALPDRSPDVPILQQFELTYLPYPGYLLKGRTTLDTSKRPRRFLAVGNLDYGIPGSVELAEVRRGDFRASLGGIAPLPGTQRELEAIRQHWSRGPVEYLTGREATVSRLGEALERSQYVHIATHGVLASEESIRAFRRLRHHRTWGRPPFVEGVRNPLSLMALALSNARRSDSIDESILLAEEIAAMDLSHVRLVVLSACDTGRGPVLRNNGAFSMHQAFLMAGARSTVSALWEVPDGATAELMREFYRRLATADDVVSALRNAQLIVSRDGLQLDPAAARGPKVTNRRRIGRTLPFRPPREWGGFFVAGVGRLE